MLVKTLVRRMRIAYRNQVSWRRYNRKVLATKNLVLWQTRTAAIALCPWCEELLIWFDLTKEADTFTLDAMLLDDLAKEVQPAIEVFYRAMIASTAAVVDGGAKPPKNAPPELATDDLRLAYGRIIIAAQNLKEKHAGKLQPQTR